MHYTKIYLAMILFGFVMLSRTLAQDGQLATDDRMEWGQAARFGMFIHWGVYSQWGGVYH